ncbi:hypothetical protein IF2G_02957 [Cordyceps javanica]|nr:hypothetical protein IF2G_02957 [Cordyceps javanica]
MGKTAVSFNRINQNVASVSDASIAFRLLGSQSVSQSVCHSVCQSVSLSVCQSVSLSVTQSVTRPVTQAASLLLALVAGATRTREPADSHQVSGKYTHESKKN